MKYGYYEGDNEIKHPILLFKSTFFGWRAFILPILNKTSQTSLHLK